MIEKEKIKIGMVFNFCSYYNNQHNTANLIPLQISSRESNGTMKAINMDTHAYMGKIYDTKYLHKINTPVLKVINDLNVEE